MLRTLLVVVAVLGAPTAAGAHNVGGPVPLGPPVPDSMTFADPDVALAIDTSRVARARNAFTDRLEHAPLERSGACATTIEFPDIGDGCRTSDGMLRIELPGGDSITTHGPDYFAARETDNPALVPPRMVAALRSASKADVSCVPATEPHTLLVYAIPADGNDRYARQVEPFRTAVYESSAIIDAEARFLVPAAGRHLRVRCDGSGVPTVLQLRLPTRLADADFSTVKQDITRALELQPYGSHVRPLVFYDAQLGNFNGIAERSDDERSDGSNDNNLGGRLALQDNGENNGPTWGTILHELTHNMGGVADNAPDSNGVAHCNDGLDVMCYAEPDTPGVRGTYVTTACAQLQYDCDHDSFFHPAPAAGSYLARSWNLASPANRYLQPYTASVDVTPPAKPSGVTGSGHGTFLRLAWSASSDAGSGVAAYRVSVHDGSDWVPVADSWTGELTVDATWEDIAPSETITISITAYDRRGNESEPFLGTISTGAVSGATRVVGGRALLAPEDVRIAARTSSSLTVAWDKVDPDGDTYSSVELWGVLCGCRVSSGTTQYDTMTFSGLTSSTRYEARAFTHDGPLHHVRSLGRASASTSVFAWTSGTTGSITAPTGLSVASSAGLAPRLTWTPVAGATSYVVSRYNGTSWDTLATTSRTESVPAGLTYGAAHTLAVAAVDERGTVSSRATTSFVAPTATVDTVAPTVPSFAVSAASTSSLRVTWSEAQDAVGVAGYRVVIATGPNYMDYVPAANVGPAERSVELVGLERATAYRVRVYARDAAGNLSITHYWRGATTSNDGAAPTVPGGVTATNVTHDGVTLAWNPSTDDVGVSRYVVYSSTGGDWSTIDSQIAATSYRVGGLEPGATYWFGIAAYDASGKGSRSSASIRVTTLAPAGDVGDDEDEDRTPRAVAPPAGQVVLVGAKQLSASARSGKLTLRFPVASAGTKVGAEVRVNVATARKLGLRIPRGAKLIVLGTGSRVVVAPGSTTLVVKLNAPARAALKRAIARRTLRKVPVTLVVTASLAGTRASSTRAATLT